MADKRMISKSISISEKVNTLPDIFDMLLFTWLVPHADDFGRLYGSATKVKALVIPLLDKSLKEVSESLENLHNAGCIAWYEIEGTKYIQIINFEHHQSGLHKRTKSKFPEVTGNNEDIPNYSRNFPEIPSEEKGREENRKEENRTEGSRASENHFSFIHETLKKYKVEVKGVIEVERVVSFVGAMDIEVVEYCIKLSEGKGVAYVLTILQRYIKEGKTTKESISTSISSPDKNIPGGVKKEVDWDEFGRQLQEGKFG